jgi:hypothetical protein
MMDLLSMLSQSGHAGIEHHHYCNIAAASRGRS